MLCNCNPDDVKYLNINIDSLHTVHCTKTPPTRNFTIGVAVIELGGMVEGIVDDLSA